MRRTRPFVQISLTAFRRDVVLRLILQLDKQKLKKGFALPVQ